MGAFHVYQIVQSITYSYPFFCISKEYFRCCQISSASLAFQKILDFGKLLMNIAVVIKVQLKNILG